MADHKETPAEKMKRQLEEIRSNIAANIRTRRTSMRMTRKDFAKDLKLSLSSISQIENGKQSLSAEKLWHVALVLGCAPEELIPPVPDEYCHYEKQLEEIRDKKTLGWAQELIKRSPSQP